MRLYTSILIAITLGCAESNSEYENSVDIEKEYNKFTEADSGTPIWVCNHPNTEYHNKPCIEAEYPNGCYVDGDNTKFCWLLTKDDCEFKNNHTPQWAHLCR